MPTKLPHTAKATYFSCIDGRLNKHHASFIATLNGGAFEPAMAGGGAAILNATDRASALKQIVAAYKINAITDVYLESHTDCGAYRLAGVTFESPEQEITRLYADLDEAARLVKDALASEGAPPDNIAIHTQVVDPAGTLIERS